MLNFFDADLDHAEAAALGQNCEHDSRPDPGEQGSLEPERRGKAGDRSSSRERLNSFQVANHFKRLIPSDCPKSERTTRYNWVAKRTNIFQPEGIALRRKITPLEFRISERSQGCAASAHSVRSHSHTMQPIGREPRLQAHFFREVFRPCGKFLRRVNANFSRDNSSTNSASPNA